MPGETSTPPPEPTTNCTICDFKLQMISNIMSLNFKKCGISFVNICPYNSLSYQDYYKLAPENPLVLLHEY